MASNKPILLYDNRFLDGTPTATDTETGYDVANIYDLRTYTYWKAASSGTKYLTIDCGSAKSADTLAINYHNLFTASATVSVESSTDNFVTNTTERLAGFTPESDKAFIKTFTSASARYWRIKIITASIAPYLAIAILGVRFTFERYVQAGFDPQKEKIKSETNKSIAGHLMGAVIEYIEIKLNASWKNLTDAWVRNTFKPIWDAHISQLKPFFFAWNITDFPNDVVFVAVPENASLEMPYDPVRRSLTLELEGIKE